MSCISFHSRKRTVDLGGSERHFMQKFCFELFWAALGVSSFHFEENRVVQLMKHTGPSGSLSPLRATDPESLYNELSAGRTFENVCFEVDGEAVPLEDVVLNTAKVLGNDTVRFMAKLAGQCEIHLFVDGSNRAWLANLIETGRQQKILRPGQNWEEVVELLQEASDDPVVTSYSVSGEFPTTAVTLDDETLYLLPHDEDEWEQLTEDEQWDLSVAALRQVNGEQSMGLEAAPETLSGLYGQSLTIFDMQEHANKVAVPSR